MLKTTQEKKHETVKIDIVLQQRWLRLLRAVTAFSVIAVVPIGVGVAVGSNAMQWLGFIISIFCIVAFCKGRADEQTFTSVEAAKAYLDRMKESGQAD